MNITAVIEKADSVGAHTISGAVVDPRGLDELMPDWREQEPPLVPVTSDEMRFLTKGGSFPLPHPPWMKNTGYWTGSLNNLVRWLGLLAVALTQGSMAAGQDLSGTIGSFINQTGVPLVEVTPRCEDGTGSLALRQSRYRPLGSTADANQTWQIPFCARYSAGGEVRRS